MSLPRKAILGAAVYLFLLTLLYVLLPNLVHRKEFDDAFVTWQKNPSPEGEAALRIQQRRNEFIQLENSAAIGLVLWSAGFACYVIARRLRC